MEQPHISPELIQSPKSPEVLKQEAFNEVLHRALSQIGYERATVTTFNHGGKQFGIDTAPAAIKALGQISHTVLQDIYKKMIPSTSYVRN